MLKVAELDKRVYDLLADWREPESDSWDSGFLSLIRRLLPWFEDEGIVYAFNHGVAIRLHGGEGGGKDASLSVTEESRERLTRTHRGRFDVSPHGSLGVTGIGFGSTVQFVESLETMRTSIHGVYVLSLPRLISDLLKPPDAYGVSRACVASLIRANDLRRSFRQQLPENRRSAYESCLRSARRSKR